MDDGRAAFDGLLLGIAGNNRNASRARSTKGALPMWMSRGFLSLDLGGLFAGT